MSAPGMPRWEDLSSSARQAVEFASGHLRLRSEQEPAYTEYAAAPQLLSDLDLLFGTSQVHGRRTQLQTVFEHFGASWETLESANSAAEAQEIPGEKLEGFPELDSTAESVLVQAGALAGTSPDGTAGQVRVRHLVGALLGGTNTGPLLSEGLRDSGVEEPDRLIDVYLNEYLGDPDADLPAVLSRYWPRSDHLARTTQSRVWVLYAAGRAPEEIATLAAGEPTAWGANRHAHKGDLLLIYVTAPVSAISYVAIAESDAFEPTDPDWSWEYAIDITPLAEVSTPVDLDLIRAHPQLSEWRFARSQQGALHWADDIRAQGFWEPLRGVLVATNPRLADPLAAWEGVSAGDLLNAARAIADEIPDSRADAAKIVDLPEQTDYQAEPRVARDYWTVEDRLGTKPYADAIAAFIRHRDTKPPLTIGIKAPWGAGKTSLMRMVQAQLDPPDDPHASTWEFPGLRLTADGLRALEGKSAGQENAERKPVTLWQALERTREAPHDAPDLQDVSASEVEGGEAERWRATVWFNPWVYQTGEEVWAGFAHEIIDQVTGRLNRADQERFWLELNLRRLDRQAVRRRIYRVVLEKLVPTAVVFALALIATVVAALFSVDIASWVGLVGSFAWIAVVASRLVAATRQDAADSVGPLVQAPDLSGLGDAARSVLEGAVDEVLPDPSYSSRAGFLHLVQTDIRHVLDLVAGEEHPLVLFVDDLDRCSPGVVAQTIEAINLFLAGEFPNVVFVLAIEPAVVAAHVDVAYADLVEKLQADPLQSDSDRLGWRFLEKIVQLPLSLPQPSRTQAEAYLDSLFTPEGESSRASLSGERDEQIEALVRSSVDEISASGAGLEELPARLGDVTDALSGQQDARAGPDVIEVRRRIVVELFEQFFTDSDPVVREIVRAEAARLPHRNAREVKRLLNLFRFYSFVAVRNRLLDPGSAASQAQTLRMVARVAVLAIRWPFLLDAMGRPGRKAPEEGEERPPILLEDLEVAAGDDAAWLDVLREAGMGNEEGDPPAWREPPYAEPFREFCRIEPLVGRFARDFL